MLLTLRSAQRRVHPGTWALPGGHVELGELETEALYRELHEELGIDVLERDEEPIHHLHLTAGAPSEHLHLSTWRVRSWRGQPRNRLVEEHERISWFSAGELEELRWAHPEHRQVLQGVLSRRDG